MSGDAVDLLLRGVRLPDRDEVVNVAIDGGVIVGVGPWRARPARASTSAAPADAGPGRSAHPPRQGAARRPRLARPPGRWPRRWRSTAKAKQAFTVDDIRARARRVLDLAVRAGTTRDAHPRRGGSHRRARRGHGGDPAAARRVRAGARICQICAFAQEGIVRAPGTEGLLRRALQMGADLVGGCPYNDSDGPEHIRIVFALATAFGVDADFHADFADEPDHLHVRDIAAHTGAGGLAGTGDGGPPHRAGGGAGFRQDEIIAEIVGAGLGVICLPAADLLSDGAAGRDERAARAHAGAPAAGGRRARRARPPTTSATRSRRWAPPTSPTWRSWPRWPRTWGRRPTCAPCWTRSPSTPPACCGERTTA